MPAALRKHVPDYEPPIVEDPSYTIGAHADYCRDHFVFRRMQSRQMQETPWVNRMKPMRSWSEIITTTLLFAVASFALVLSAAFV